MVDPGGGADEAVDGLGDHERPPLAHDSLRLTKNDLDFARVALVADRVRARLDPIGAHDLVSQDLLASIGLGLDEQRWMLHDQRS